MFFSALGLGELLPLQTCPFPDDAKDPDLPAVKAVEASQPLSGSSLEERLEDVERETTLQALERARYNKTAVARIHGITFRALRCRLKKLELE